MAILPTGTWNALAQALDIPLQIDGAIALLFQEHEIRTIDAMQVGEKFYVLGVSAGVAAQTMAGCGTTGKTPLGKAGRYIERLIQDFEISFVPL